MKDPGGIPRFVFVSWGVICGVFAESFVKGIIAAVAGCIILWWIQREREKSL